jgi:hypothetical protein
MRHPVLVLIATLGALTGGILWAVKGLAILIADSQPEYTFEIGLACFGVATLGIASKVSSSRRARGTVTILAWVAALAGIASLVTGEGAGDLLTMVTALSTLAVLLYGGHKVRAWSALPFYLGCIYVLSLPVGGALAAIDERLLEIPLLAVALGWIALAGRMASDTRSQRLPAESPASTG